MQYSAFAARVMAHRAILHGPGRTDGAGAGDLLPPATGCDGREYRVPTQDRIFLEGLTFYAYHGVHPEEKKLGQRFIVDIAFTRDLGAAGTTDDLTRTTSYSDVYRKAREIVEGGPYDLIETVAEKIAAAVLAIDAAVEDVRVTVRKPEVPMKGSILSAVGVEVFRIREHA